VKPSIPAAEHGSSYLFEQSFLSALILTSIFLFRIYVAVLFPLVFLEHSSGFLEETCVLCSTFLKAVQCSPLWRSFRFSLEKETKVQNEGTALGTSHWLVESLEML